MKILSKRDLKRVTILFTSLALVLSSTGCSFKLPFSGAEKSSVETPENKWSLPSTDNFGWAISSDETIPDMPSTLQGFQKSGTLVRTTVRAFSNQWSTDFEFPATMNSCGQQLFTIRWRSLNLDVASSLVSSPDEIVLEKSLEPAVAGYMLSYGCGQPAFKLPAIASNANKLTDVNVEYQVWIPKI